MRYDGTAATSNGGAGVKLKLAGASIAVVVLLTIAAAAFRVWTAPERIRMRLDAARATCLNAGGQWIKVGREEACKPAPEGTKI